MRTCTFLAIFAGIGAAIPLVAAESFVTRSGQYLTLDKKPIHLHGGSFYGAPWRGDTFNQYVDTWMKYAQDNGMNTIRICDFIDNHDRDQWKDARTWAQVDYLLGAISARKMFAILDLSTYRNLLERTCKKDPAVDKDKFSVAAAYDAKNWEAFTAFVSQRCRNSPCIAFYSIAGEAEIPHNKVLTTAGLTAFFDKVSTQLHAGDPNHQISSGGLLQLDWNSGIDWRAIFKLPNIHMAAVHVYGKGDAAVVPEIAQWARDPANDVPFIIEEFGLKQGDDPVLRAKQLKDIYALGSRYTTLGSLFWNFGAENYKDSCDIGPQTEVSWAMVRESETWFQNGFEAADAQPLQPAAVAHASFASPPAARSPIGVLECEILDESPHTGSGALAFAVPQNHDKSGTCQLYRVGLAIRKSTILGYWINPDQAAARFVAIDVHCSDGTWLHDVPALDQHGKGMDAKSGHGGAIPIHVWSEIRCPVGQWLDGKMVDAIALRYEHPSAAGAFSGHIDDLVITNGALESNHPVPESMPKR